jgi:predicted outer membrane lipoprotein
MDGAAKPAAIALSLSIGAVLAAAFAILGAALGLARSLRHAKSRA